MGTKKKAKGKKSAAGGAGQGQPDELDRLCARIQKEHAACMEGLRTSMKHARKTGTLLIEAKELVEAQGHKWTEWVQENCTFSISQEQRYRRIADNYATLLKEVKDPENLTMQEALRILSPGKPRPDGKGDPTFEMSEMEAREHVREAEYIEFQDGTPEHDYIQKEVARLVREVLAKARRLKVADAEDRPVEPVQVAMALLRHLKEAIDPSLAVTIRKPPPPPAARPVRSVGPRPAGPHVGTNRVAAILNGK